MDVSCEHLPIDETCSNLEGVQWSPETEKGDAMQMN